MMPMLEPKDQQQRGLCKDESYMKLYVCVDRVHMPLPAQASPEERAEAEEALKKYDQLANDEQRTRFRSIRMMMQTRTYV